MKPLKLASTFQQSANQYWRWEEKHRRKGRMVLALYYHGRASAFEECAKMLREAIRSNRQLQ